MNNPSLLKKNVIIVLILVLFLIFLFLFFFEKNENNNIRDNTSNLVEDNEALLVLNYGNGKERWFKGEVMEGMTIKNVLEAASLIGNFTFKANSHLSFIDNFYSNNQRKWKCYYNNQEVKEGLNEKIVKPKDKIYCTYE